MRLSWFTSLRAGRRPKGKRQKLKSVPLRVRQLERRRVLDGAATTVVAAVVTDVTQQAPTPTATQSPAQSNSTDEATSTSTTVHATDAPPVVVPPLEATPSGNSLNISQFAAADLSSPGQGLAGNTVPVLVPQVKQQVDEGHPLDLSGQNSHPSLAFYVDPDLADTHTATVDWGDGSPVENATITAGVGNGAIGGTHTYADNGNYTVTVSVADNNGGSASGSFNVLVKNVPPVLVTAPDQMVNEGQQLNLSGSGGAPPLGLFVDPGILDTHTATVDWGDGSPVQNATVVEGSGAGALGGTHTYADDGVYTVTLTVKDDDGGSDTKTFKVNVLDVKPTVDLNSIPDINENGFVTLTGTYTDPGLRDTQTLKVAWDDPNNSAASTFAIGAIQNSSGATTLHVGDMFNSSTDSAVLTITSVDASTGQVGFSIAQHQYLDDGLAPGNGTTFDVSTISVSLTDDENQTGSDTTSLTVHNVTSNVALNGVSDINENGVATLSGSFTDIGLVDVHTLTIDWGDPNNAAASIFTVSAIQNASGTATLHVNDTFSSADGAILTITSIDAATGQVGFTAQHQYLDDGLAPGNGTSSDTNTITVTVADDDAQSGSSTGTVTVHNASPTVSLVPTPPINENGLATVTGTYTDTALLDQHTLTVDWDDPNNSTNSSFAVASIFDGGGTQTLLVNDTFTSLDGAVLTITSVNTTTGHVGFSVQHQYVDDGPSPGNIFSSDLSIVVATVADDDGQSAMATATIPVTNVPPTVAVNVVSPINENGTATLTGSFTDIGLRDQHTLTVDWDDPNNSTNSTFLVPSVLNVGGSPNFHVGDTFNSSTDAAVLTITSIDAATGTVSFRVQHQYLDDGLAPGNNTASDTSTISVTIADDDSGAMASSTSVTINNVAPTVALDSVPSINENGVATLAGSYTDIGLLDGHTVTVDWDDPNNAVASTFTVPSIFNTGGTQTLNAGDTFSSADGAVLTITAVNAATGQVGFSVQHQYLDDGLAPGNNTTSDTSTIGVTVADDDAQSGNDTSTVTVDNVGPSVALSAVPDINENGIATLTGSYTDIGLLDAHTVTVNWADPNNAAASTFAVNAIHNAGGTGTLHVGETFNSSTDSAILTITSIDTTTGQVGFSVEHQYLDDGLALGNDTTSDVSTIGVSVADDDGQSGSHTAMVTVHNVTPSVALNAVPDIDENGVATLTGSYTDIGLLDVHVLTVNWADANNGAASTFAIGAIRDAAGTPTLSVGDVFNSSTPGDTQTVLTIESIDPATGEVGFSVQHQYLDDGPAPGNGTTSDISTIGVTVADDDAQAGNNTTTVTVHNVAPTIVDLTGDSIDEGQVATVTMNVGDPGTLDVFTVNVDWRDGSTATIPNLGATDAQGNINETHFEWTAATRQLTVTHLYADNADYQVVVKMADDDMAADFDGAPSDANYAQEITPVHVANVLPDLAGTANRSVDEGSPVTLAGLGVHIVDPGFDNPDNQTATTPGNLTNEDFTAFSIDWGDNSPTEITTPVNVVNRVSGTLGPGLLTSSATTADFQHAAHFYADDGVYTVTVRMADDNMGAYSDPTLFTTGVAGVDYIDRTFEITVKNVTPTLGVTSVASQEKTGSGTVTTTPVTPATTVTISESGTVSLAADFTDPGFSLDPNPSTPAGTSFPRNEVFRYYINWGDNRETIGELSAADVANLTNGGPSVLTSGAFDTTGMVHTYADDGTYTVTIRLADDNMGAFTDSSKFANGVGVDFGTDNGGDYVETKFTVVVNNIAPSFVPQPDGENVVGTQVTSEGNSTISVAFSDPGFDNTANLNAAAPPTITDTHHETFTHVVDWGDGTVDAVHTYTDSSAHDVTITQTGPGGTQTFTIPGIGNAGGVLTLVSSQDINNPAAVMQPFTYMVDWGDGNVQTISLMLRSPGGPTVNGQTTVNTLVRTSGNVGVETTGSLNFTHKYLGPPDPLNPTNDIKITVSVLDDNNGSVTDFTTVTNPGINTFNVAIDTTPDVPHLDIVQPQFVPVILDQTSAAPSSLQANVPRVVHNELATTSDHYLELVVVSPDGNETERYRLSDEALVDLRALFATLPDNRYKIYLIRTDNPRRLVMDVFVRRGRVVDPSDDSEGSRDRPPATEEAHQNNGQQNNGQQNNGQQINGPPKQVVPLKNNPLLQPAPTGNSGATNEQSLPAIGAESGLGSIQKELSDSHSLRFRGSVPWALPLAGLGLLATRESWSERLGAALETADEQAWQRLRRAGRLGRSGGKAFDKSRTGPEKLALKANTPS